MPEAEVKVPGAPGSYANPSAGVWKAVWKLGWLLIPVSVYLEVLVS